MDYYSDEMLDHYEQERNERDAERARLVQLRERSIALLSQIEGEDTDFSTRPFDEVLLCCWVRHRTELDLEKMGA